MQLNAREVLCGMLYAPEFLSMDMPVVDSSKQEAFDNNASPGQLPEMAHELTKRPGETDHQLGFKQTKTSKEQSLRLLEESKAKRMQTQLEKQKPSVEEIKLPEKPMTHGQWLESQLLQSQKSG